LPMPFFLCSAIRFCHSCREHVGAIRFFPLGPVSCVAKPGRLRRLVGAGDHDRARPQNHGSIRAAPALQEHAGRCRPERLYLGLCRIQRMNLAVTSEVKSFPSVRRHDHVQADMRSRTMPRRSRMPTATSFNNFGYDPGGHLAPSCVVGPVTRLAGHMCHLDAEAASVSQSLTNSRRQAAASSQTMNLPALRNEPYRQPPACVRWCIMRTFCKFCASVDSFSCSASFVFLRRHRDPPAQQGIHFPTAVDSPYACCQIDAALVRSKSCIRGRCRV